MAEKRVRMDNWTNRSAVFKCGLNVQFWGLFCFSFVVFFLAQLLAALALCQWQRFLVFFVMLNGIGYSPSKCCGNFYPYVL